MLAEIAALMLSCAPSISPVTLDAVITHESRANQYAIGVNDSAKRLSKQPDSLDEAVLIVNDLIRQGIDFDAGLGQINVRNWSWLGLDARNVFEPCANLKAAATILTKCYEKAIKAHRQEQDALAAALSCYNTGNLVNGFKNGYVASVIAKAKTKTFVPAIANGTNPVAISKAKKPKPKGIQDGFSANPTADGFSAHPAPSHF